MDASDAAVVGIDAINLAVYKRQDRLVIDDCYNANPQSMAEGIRMLAASRQKKRLAVLGDMGELGALTAQAHRDMGTLCRELGIELSLIHI